MEARAHIARAAGDLGECATLLTSAAAGFETAGQPGDTARCRRTLEDLHAVSLPGPA